MDDAAASDNCGEVTIEVSVRRRPAMPRQLLIVRTFTATDDAGNSAATNHHGSGHDGNWFSFVPADYTVECTDEMPMDDATASDNCGEVTIEVSSETMPGNATATTPSSAPSPPPTMPETARRNPDHFGARHHRT